jgi:hypothetical protein
MVGGRAAYEIEGDIVTTGDEVQPLVLALRLKVADDIATEVKSDASEVCNREERHIDVGEVVLARRIV